MASQPPGAPPESVVLGQFSGLHNTVTRERLGADQLVRAVNVDLSDAGQLSRRRGYRKRLTGSWRSVTGIDDIIYGVRDGVLGYCLADIKFQPLGIAVGTAPVCYTEVGGDVYFSSSVAQGVILGKDMSVIPWGKTGGQGTWNSPVYSPTATLGEVGGKLLGDPPAATSLGAYKGRIYLAVGAILWATELFQFHFVDRTKNFMQFEDPITMISVASDGLWIGTSGGLYFLRGSLEAFRPLEQFNVTKVSDDAVIPGSQVYAPGELIKPQTSDAPQPSGTAAMFMTAGGILAAFDGGACFNVTIGKFLFPTAVNAASLFRQDQGANTYVAAIDSAGGPSSTARIGDYCDAEIIRGGG